MGRANNKLTYLPMSRMVNLNKITAFSDQSESDRDINSIVNSMYPVSYTSDFPEALDEIKDILQIAFVDQVSNAELLSVISRLPEPYDRDIFLDFVKSDATSKVEQECSLFTPGERRVVEDDNRDEVDDDSGDEDGRGIQFTSEKVFLTNISFNAVIAPFRNAAECSTSIDFEIAAKNHFKKVEEDTQTDEVSLIINKAIQELELKATEDSLKLNSIVRESFKKGLIKYS